MGLLCLGTQFCVSSAKNRTVTQCPKVFSDVTQTNRTKCLIPYQLEKCWCNNEESIQEFLCKPCTPWLLRYFFILYSLCLSASLKRLCLDIDISLFPVSFCFFICVFCLEVCVFPLDSYDSKAPSEECYYVWRSPLSYMCFTLFQDFVLLRFCFWFQRSRFNTSHSAAPETSSFSLVRLQRADVFCIWCATLEGWHQDMHRSYFTPKSNAKKKNYWHNVQKKLHLFSWHLSTLKFSLPNVKKPLL